MEDRITLLFVKEQSGDLTDAERLELHQYLVTPEYKSFYDDLLMRWNQSGQLKAAAQFNTEAEWEKMSRRIESQPVSIGWTKVLKRIAAVLLIGLGVGFYFYSQSSDIRVATAVGEKREVTLPDGTVVMLNSESSISYDKDFGLKGRRVEFEGEAFFNVVRDKSKAFEIFSGNASVTVLGTSFNVRSMLNQNSTVVDVATGIVALANVSTGEKVRLEHGMRGVLDEAGKVTASTPELNNSNFWRTGILAYENSRLTDVVEDLNRQFTTAIELESPSILNCRFTGTFTGSDLDEILEIISASMGLSYEARDDGYVLTGQGCDQFVN